jgi:hypothetical protein
MSYSKAVKLQYLVLGMVTGFVITSLVVGAVFINLGADMALNGLNVPQTGNLDDVSLENGLQGSTYQLQPAINVK